MLQIIVPRKRAAILIDRLMVALKKAIEEEEAAAGTGQAGGSGSKTAKYSLTPEDAVRTVIIDLNCFSVLHVYPNYLIIYNIYYN